ncbi:MAG: hypothetical protein L3I99_08075 [Sulfurimonas sp.]|nr:hypothetical protein [Sulfurimonas sp.]
MKIITTIGTSLVTNQINPPRNKKDLNSEVKESDNFYLYKVFQNHDKYENYLEKIFEDKFKDDIVKNILPQENQTTFCKV